ncbi:TIGR00730 family Rossman fold protein [Thermomonas carbonis]|uniref:Cytokinin riboside 5'-monophosphate phosphoribohydrolase n=1 Tax=Thermomonas carbonis TaxID=1463158 RepID=A0A7G9SNS1_9GAMM|nr:TIGR00730 family Rossman fold protein [Thermomonas carbonis]QNN69496.1 TIGR00730 family Rossman fold protein [Thermomonas carbonis]
MKTICVYCGSNAGNDPAYASQAKALGARLAADNIALVYGGGNVGLMGIVADAVLANGGDVIGVIPQQLVDWEVAHRGVTRLEVVDSMHTRKARMFELSDGFVALPGGFGTLDEMFEMLTWRQLGLGKKPCAFLDVNGFWQPLMAMLDTMVRERFLHAEQRDDLWHGEDIDALLAWMRDYVPAQADKWLDEKRRSQLKLTPEDV